MTISFLEILFRYGMVSWEDGPYEIPALRHRSVALAHAVAGMSGKGVGMSEDEIPASDSPAGDSGLSFVAHENRNDGAEAEEEEIKTHYPYFGKDAEGRKIAHIDARTVVMPRNGATLEELSAKYAIDSMGFEQNCTVLDRMRKLKYKIMEMETIKTNQ